MPELPFFCTDNRQKELPMRSNHGKAIGAMILLISLALPGTVLGCDGCGGNDYWIFEGEAYSKSSWSIEATSYLADDAADCSPASAIDGDYTTAWVEGVDGPGIGESLTLSFGVSTKLWDIALLPGYFASLELWVANNRVKKVQITLSDGTSVTEEFEDVKQGLYVLFSDTHQVEWIRLTIPEVYPGNHWDDTAISEVAINTGG